MKVRDIMTRTVATCTPTTSLPQVVSLMRDACCGIIPVVDSHSRVAGVVTDRDISLAIASSHRHPVNLAAHEIMSRRVHACAPDDDVKAVLQTMKQCHVRRLPVVSEEGLLRGIVSIDDVILRALAPDAPTSAEIIASLRDILTHPEEPVAAGEWAAPAFPG